MKLIPASICALIFTLPAVAEQVLPEITVEGAIRAAHDDSLSELISTADLVAIAARQRHGLQPEAVIEKLIAIELESVEFQTATYQMGDETIVVRMIAPIILNFEMSRYPAAEGKPTFTYRITSIY